MQYTTLVFDLDGTLAPSKNPPSEKMSGLLCQALAYFNVAVVSGARFEQFTSQLVSHLPCKDFSKLLLAPTNGAALYSFSEGNWKCVEKHELNPEEKERIFEVIHEALEQFKIPTTVREYGEQIEDRDSQITFSGCGQKAPIEVKKTWDPDASLRTKLATYIQNNLPEFEVRVGGMTSIDITQKGFDKAYALKRIFSFWNVSPEEVLFIGDSLFAGGNDETAKKAGEQTFQVSGPEETEKLLERLILDKIGMI